MPDVFISYSRRNLDFVNQLVYALKWRGKDPWFDQLKEPLSGIVAGAPWWKQIQDGIENVDNFLFVISPNSISSPYCHAEINYAREHGKRLVPVLHCGSIGEGDTRKAIEAAIEAIPDSDETPDSVTSSILNLKQLVRANWLAISEIQYVVFAPPIVPFEQSLEELVQALDLDLAWVKMYNQLTQAVKLWEANKRNDGYLWSAERLKPVHEMIERRKPELDPLVQEFIEPEQERLIRELKNLKTIHQRRVQIGVRLAAIETRHGVGVAVVNLRGRAVAVPEIDWCPVAPGGKLTIEGQKFSVSPFSIARYLITYQQFQAFVDDADEFANAQWWRGMLEEYQQQKIVDARNQFTNAPRDMVTWYQAVAFCRWLDSLHTQLGWKVDPSQQIRLPTEWEWQWAAQGDEGREYPWGPWDDQPRANTVEAGISQSTAVGLYPDGAAVCGALDMAGNLFEWCLNDHQNIVGISLDNDADKALRGGSFNSGQNYAAAASRYYDLFSLNPPGYAFDGRGFRVVLSSHIPPL